MEMDEALKALVGKVLDNQQKIKQYRLEAMLGSGGFGAVYRAECVKKHHTLVSKVAIKVISPKHKNLEDQERFLQEGQILYDFDHPNIVIVYDLLKTSDGLIYMVMEYLEGHDLRKEMAKKGIFSAKEALELIAPVANALNVAHARNITHRDIKPENIMISPSVNNKTVVKLLDFGIAKLEGAPKLTPIRLEIRPLGTAPYISPEQWGYPPQYIKLLKQGQISAEESGEDFDINGRADIYSLGIVIYEMVTGEKPITIKQNPDSDKQRESFQWMQAHLSTIPIAAHVVNANVPEAFSAVLDRAMAKDRDERPATCQEFMEQLRKALESPIKPLRDNAVYGATVELKDTNANNSLENSSKSNTEDTNLVGEFIYISAGEFMMGSNKNKNEQPIHKVIISRGFEMGKYPVTQGEWEAVMGSNPSRFKGINLPVETVSWSDTQKFINKLNDLNGEYTYRLPTEAEWEYACRAGTTGDYAGELDKMGWYDKNSESKTHVVGQKSPNAWGLYDMHGNVWEWCSDWYGNYASGSVTDPSGVSSGSNRVYRGGSWFLTAVGCRSAYRSYNTPDSRYDGVGFRLVRTAR